jgi:hypothetical protein
VLERQTPLNEHEASSEHLVSSSDFTGGTFDILGQTCALLSTLDIASRSTLRALIANYTIARAISPAGLHV